MQLQVNLLPKQYRPKPAVRIWPVILTLVFVLNIIGMGSWWLFLQLDLAASLVNLALINDEIGKLEYQVQDMESAAVLQTAVLAKREFISGRIDESIYWHPFLNAVERAMVPGVQLNGIAASNSGDVSLGGMTDTVKSVADLLGSLQDETGLPVIRASSITPEGPFQISLQEWSGREVEVPEDEE